MQLRPYQVRAVEQTRDAMKTHRAVCLVMQVGAGKTVVACEIIRRALERGRRCMFVVHRVELVEQARDRLAKFGIRAGIIKAGYPERRDRPVQVACVPTLVRREFPDAQLTILDECHHAASESWLKVARHYRECGWLLGISATPARLDGKGLGAIFDTLLDPVSTAELVNDGYLVAPTVFAPPESCDRRGLHTRGGDFALPEIAERMQKLTGSVTEYWERYGRGRRTLCFAVNVGHSRRIKGALTAVGARAMHVDGTSSKRDRLKANAQLRSGELDVVTQCNLWTEGVDIPEIDCIIIARPTQSLGLHRQTIGRGMRPAPGKTGCIVLDHAGNSLAHGLVTDPITWSLDAPVKRERTALSVRTCLLCFAIIPPGADRCVACGAEIQKRDEAEAPGVENAGELVELVAPPVRVFEKAAPDVKAEAYRELVARASVRGHKLGAARVQYKERFGTWPRFGEIERELYRCSGHTWERKVYGWQTVARCTRCFATGTQADLVEVKA